MPWHLNAPTVPLLFAVAAMWSSTRLMGISISFHRSTALMVNVPLLPTRWHKLCVSSTCHRITSLIAFISLLQWEIEHLRDHEYHILATGPPPDLQGQPAVDRQELLYVIRNVQPEVWVICGEHNPTAPNESLYMYFIIPLRIPLFLVLIMAYLTALKRSCPLTLRSRLQPCLQVGCLQAPLKALRYSYQLVWN